MGTDLTTGQTVASKTEDKTVTETDRLSSGVFSAEDALYLVELMKLQMQSRVMAASQSLLSDTGSDIL